MTDEGAEKCYFPMQKVERMRLRMSSAVLAPVIASMGRSVVEIEEQHLIRDANGHRIASAIERTERLAQ